MPPAIEPSAAVGAGLAGHREDTFANDKGVLQSGRVRHLDGLRFFAFLAVFLHHSIHVPMLWAGVDVFFVLSGYLITGILLRTKGSGNYFSNFYKRRFLRIFPPYYLLLAATFVFFEKNAGTGIVLVYAGYLSNFNDAYNVVGPRVSSLSSMWSLAVEEQFYLLWPLLVMFLGSRRLTGLCFALVLVAPILRIIAGLGSAGHWPAYYLLPCRMDLLALGAIIAVYEAKLSSDEFVRVSSYGIALAFACASSFVLLALCVADFRTGANSILFNSVGYTLVALSAFGFLAWLIPRGQSLVGRWLSLAPIVYLGSVSYVLYLAHQLVIDQIAKLNLPAFVAAPLSLAIVVVVAAISWRYVETPVQRLKTVWAPYKTRGSAGSRS